jgi:hypothetical protein
MVNSLPGRLHFYRSRASNPDPPEGGADDVRHTDNRVPYSKP